MIHKGLRFFIAFIMCIASCYHGLHAQIPGRVDTLFNIAKGMGFTGTSRVSFVSDGIELPNGSIIVVGNFTAVEAKSVGRIAKLDSNGNLDLSFNAAGVGANGPIYAIKRQADGKFIIGGEFTSYNGTARNRIARLNADGTLDNSFSIGTGFNNGVYSIYLPCDTSTCDSLIIVGGFFTAYNGSSVNHIVRLKMDGSRDATFSTAASGLSYIFGIARQSTGKYIITGYTSSTGSSIRRLNSNGTLDATFNPGGLGARYPGFNHYTYSTIVLPDDKIIVGGNFIIYDDSTSTDSSAVRLVRLHPNGVRDNSLNIGSGFNNIVRNVYCSQDGKIVVTGTFTSYKGTSCNRIICIDSTGKVDSTFAIGTGLNVGGTKIFEGTSNKLYVVGEFNTYRGIAKWGAVRVNADGSADNSFLAQSGLNGPVLDVAVQNDGKIILVGQFTKYNDADVGYIARLNLDGTLDASFNTSGLGANNTVRSVEVLPSGKILIGGDFITYNSVSRGRIALLNSDGSLDNAVFVSGANNSVTDIEISSTGKIYVTGNFSLIGGVARSRIACFNANYTLNNSGIGSKSINSTVYHVLELNNNRILFSGNLTAYNGITRGQLICIDTLGNIDSTFYLGSGLTTSYSGATMRMQRDGKVLLSSGNIIYNGVSKGCFARLNADGSLDNSYSSTHTGNYSGGFDMVEMDAGILVGGDHFTLNGQTNMGLGYVNTNGSANTEFFQNGGICGVYNIAVMRTIPDNSRGRILVAGEFSTIQNKLSPYIASLDNFTNQIEIAPTLCSGTTTTLYYNKGITFNTGNIFTVQLSNSTGSFASPVVIGRDTVSGWGADSVQITIPSSTAYGTGYKVRIISTSPVFTSLSTNAITIGLAPSASILGDTIFCTGDTIALSIPVSGSYLWSTGATSPSIQISASGIYTVTVTDNGCSATASKTASSLDPSSLAASLPYNLFVRSDTCFRFSLDSFGISVDSLEWSFGNTFDTVHAMGKEDSIVICVMPGTVDTVWFRPFVSGINCKGNISYISLMVMKNPIEVLWFNEGGAIQEVHVADKLEFTVPNNFYAITDSVDFYYKIIDTGGSTVTAISNVGYSSNGNYEITSLGALLPGERYRLDLVKYNGNTYSFILIKN